MDLIASLPLPALRSNREATFRSIVQIRLARLLFLSEKLARRRFVVRSFFVGLKVVSAAGFEPAICAVLLADNPRISRFHSEILSPSA